MSLSGMLSMVRMEEILEWLQSGAKTGALELENEHFRKTLYFSQGLVVGLLSNEPNDALADRLQAAGLLSGDQASAASQVQRRTGRPLLDVLHKTGAVEADALEAAIDEQVREGVLGLFLWREGRFRFHAGREPEELPAAVSFAVIDLIPEGQRRRRRADEIRAWFPGPAVPFRLSVDPCQIPLGAPLEEEVASLLARPHTVFSLMLSTRASEYDLLEVVASLIEQQAIAFVPAQEEEARAFIEGLAHTTARIELRGQAAAAISALGATRGAALGHAATVVSTRPVAVLEVVSAPPPVRPAAKDLLAQARREMERKHYALALDLFRQAEAADPADPRLPVLRAGAESVYAEVLYRGELPATGQPVSAVSPSRMSELPPLAAALLGRMDGCRTLREIASGAGVPEVVALTQLLGLRRDGYFEV